jgi:ABC-type amino acid transport substrate-binding protein
MKTTGNMMAAIRGLAAVLVLLLAAGLLPATAAAQDIVKPLKAGRLAVSFAYQFELLDAALQRSVSKYGPYKEEPYLETMSAGRDQIEGPRGELINLLIANVGVSALDDGMIHVPVPLDRGLLGTRISFIRADQQAELDKVKSLEDLRHVMLGQGEGWGDVKILQHNGLGVETAPDYNSLLDMLEKGRFVLFPRGATEVTAEFQTYREKHPNLAIDQRLVIRYPNPQYFYVAKNAPRLAERIEFGLKAMLKDGSFDAIYNKHFAAALAELKLDQRTVIDIENPFLPDWAKAAAN